MKRGSWLVAIPFLTLAETPAHAQIDHDAIEDRAGGLLDRLIGEGSHFDARGGVWFASLSRGPFAAWSTELASESGLDFETPAYAARRVARGKGTLRDIGLELAIKGNEAFFDYVSDELFEEEQRAIEENTPNGPVREGILYLAGEFRPDLKLLGDDARPWINVTYGRFEGRIEDASFFRSRDGQPFFAGDNSPWTTRYTSIEAGVFFGDDGMTRDDSGNEFRLGYFGRYIEFDMPVVLSFLSSSSGDYALQNGAFRAFGLGARLELDVCAPFFCMTGDTSIIPIAGYGSVDLGPWGEVPGLPMIWMANAGVAFPVPLGPILIKPYASVRADWIGLVNIGGSGGDAGLGGLDVEQNIPDYFIWGPRVGVEVQL